MATFSTRQNVALTGGFFRSIYYRSAKFNRIHHIQHIPIVGACIPSTCPQVTSATYVHVFYWLLTLDCGTCSIPFGPSSPEYVSSTKVAVVITNQALSFKLDSFASNGLHYSLRSIRHKCTLGYVLSVSQET